MTQVSQIPSLGRKGWGKGQNKKKCRCHILNIPVVGAESLEELAEHDLVDVGDVVEVDVLGRLVVLRHLLDRLLRVRLIRRVGLVVLLGGRRNTWSLKKASTHTSNQTFKLKGSIVVTSCCCLDFVFCAAGLIERELEGALT